MLEVWLRIDAFAFASHSYHREWNTFATIDREVVLAIDLRTHMYVSFAANTYFHSIHSGLFSIQIVDNNLHYHFLYSKHFNEHRLTSFHYIDMV